MGVVNRLSTHLIFSTLYSDSTQTLVERMTLTMLILLPQLRTFLPPVGLNRTAGVLSVWQRVVLESVYRQVGRYLLP